MADPLEIAGRLWDLDALAATSDELTGLVGEALEWLEPGDPAVLVDTFLLSVAVVRFLSAEPQLPGELVGGEWPPDALRTAYDRLEGCPRRRLGDVPARRDGRRAHRSLQHLIAANNSCKTGRVEALLTDRSAGFLADGALIDRILEHLDRGTTDLSDSTWREPVANYQSADRLRREIEVVLRSQPVPFCPSVALPAGGSYVARVAGGTPIVAIRGDDGVVRAFRNSCRHRGTALVAGHGCARSLVCPFHGWVYRLDGALRHVPDQYGFPGLDLASNGLVPVATTEGQRRGLRRPERERDRRGGAGAVFPRCSARSSSCSAPTRT